MPWLRRHLAVLLLLAAVPVLVGASAFAWSDSHRVIPGLRGCTYVRDVVESGRCVEREIRSEMRGRSARAGLARVERMAAKDAFVRSRCHLALHPVGERIGARAAKDGAAPPSAGGRSVCADGLEHGTLIGYAEATDGSLASVIPRLCAADQLVGSACAHVVGHLVARRDAEDPHAAVAQTCNPDTPELLAATATAGRQAETRAVVVGSLDDCRRGGYMEIALMQEQPPLARWAAGCTERAPDSVAAYCYAWLSPLASWHEEPQADAAAQCGASGLSAAQVDACLVGLARIALPPITCDSFVKRELQQRCRKLLPVKK